MNLEITAESTSAFSISILHEGNAQAFWLEQKGGQWLLDGRWVASKTIEWPEALARALRLATGAGLARRTRAAIAGNNL